MDAPLPSRLTDPESAPRDRPGASVPAAGEAVDLRSDTVTRPTAAMRRAMAEAEVGDDVLDGDPTARQLEERTAALLGKEAALFFPTGTMANQAALLLLSRPGTEAVCEAEAHLVHYEYANAAMLAGVQLRTVPSEKGRIRAADYERMVRSGDRYHPVTTVLCLENTHNLWGGTVLPLEEMEAVRELARRHGLAVHLDGARLWNASAATGIDPAAYAECADTVMVSLSKGLGCPIGSMLAGSKDLMERAWTVRKRLGGGMRQVGILAAAGLYALEHHRNRIEQDHRRAQELARGWRELEGLAAEEPETNIVLVEVQDPALCGRRIEEEMERRGVRLLALDDRRLRAVTHLEIDDAGVERAVEVMREAVAAGRGASA